MESELNVSIDFQIKFLECVISRPLPSMHDVYALFMWAPSILAKNIILKPIYILSVESFGVKRRGRTIDSGFKSETLILFYIRQDKQDYQNNIHLRREEEMQRIYR